MFKMNQLVVGLFLFLSSLFSCQQKGDFKTVNVDEFDSFIQDEEVQRLDVRTLAEYCRSGKRSKQAAAILSEKGYKVIELGKGFNAWQAAGKEIEH